MVTIMCRAKLQKAIAAAGLPWAASRQERVAGPERLGRWAATLVDEDAYVVALNEHTCLTLVVALRPTESFRERFADSLRAALVGLGVPEDAADIEHAALREAPFVRLRAPELADDSDFAELEAGAHIEDGQDPLSVQGMLNTFPYSACGAGDPDQAVRLLFCAQEQVN